jgi:hypothetical protein
MPVATAADAHACPLADARPCYCPLLLLLLLMLLLMRVMMPVAAADDDDADARHEQLLMPVKDAALVARLVDFYGLGQVPPPRSAHCFPPT